MNFCENCRRVFFYVQNINIIEEAKKCFNTNSYHIGIIHYKKINKSGQF